jgi:hypothetical protein
MLRIIANLLLLNKRSFISLDDIENNIIQRYSRGDIYLQSSLFITEKDQKKLEKDIIKLKF